MTKFSLAASPPTMIIPSGTEIQVDVHGQLSIRTPGNLVIQNSGNFGTIESVAGSIRIESSAQVDAVSIRCAETCYVQGSLTAWKVAARAIQLEEKAQANIVLQETERLEVGREARLVGNFASEKELFLLFSRFAQQFRSLPFFFDREEEEDGGTASLEEGEDRFLAEGVTPRPAAAPADGEPELPDPLFFALVLLEREVDRASYGPTSRRVIRELIKLVEERDLEALRLTYRTLFGRIVEPGNDVRRAYELMRSHFRGAEQ